MTTTEYREIYDFTVHLLRTFRGTGKQFYLGHWEGDWHLRPGYEPKLFESERGTLISPAEFGIDSDLAWKRVSG